MARAMLVGCGCHGRAAASILAERGWAVRGSSRGGVGRTAIAAAGLEAVEADPDRVGSIVELLGDVTVLAWLLGDVADPAGAELNGPRLESLLQKLVDTPVRGFVFEPPPSGAGKALVADAVARWHLPVELIETSRDEPDAWARAVADAVERSVGLA